MNRVRKLDTNYIPKGIFPASNYTIDLDSITDEEAEEMDEVLGFPDTIEDSSGPVNPALINNSVSLSASSCNKEVPTNDPSTIKTEIKEDDHREEDASIDISSNDEIPQNQEEASIIEDSPTQPRRSKREAFQQARLKMLKYV